jgi:hypothetical protein
VTRRGPLIFSPEATRLINQGPPWRDPPEPPEPRERIVRPAPTGLAGFLESLPEAQPKEHT